MCAFADCCCIMLGFGWGGRGRYVLRIVRAHVVCPLCWGEGHEETLDARPWTLHVILLELCHGVCVVGSKWVYASPDATALIQ